MSDETTAIRAALAKLDPKNDEHWTENGNPRLDALGFTPTPKRADVTNAAPLFTRTNPTLEAAPIKVTEDAPDTVTVEPVYDPEAEAEKLAALQAEIDEAQVEVNAAMAAMNEAKAKFEAAQEKQTVLIRKMEQTAHSRQGLENIHGIQRVLESHKREREQAAGLALELRKTGITPGMFTGMSRIDSVMQRKTGHGMNRPNLTARS
jgi:hypothetical protein